MDEVQILPIDRTDSLLKEVKIMRKSAKGNEVNADIVKWGCLVICMAVFTNFSGSI